MIRGHNKGTAEVNRFIMNIEILIIYRDHIITLPVAIIIAIRVVSDWIWYGNRCVFGNGICNRIITRSKNDRTHFAFFPRRTKGGCAIYSNRFAAVIGGTAVFQLPTTLHHTFLC